MRRDALTIQILTKRRNKTTKNTLIKCEAGELKFKKKKIRADTRVNKAIRIDRFALGVLINDHQLILAQL